MKRILDMYLSSTGDSRFKTTNVGNALLGSLIKKHNLNYPATLVVSEFINLLEGFGILKDIQNV